AADRARRGPLRPPGAQAPGAPSLDGRRCAVEGRMTIDFEGLGQRIAAVQDRRVVTLRAAQKAREAFLATSRSVAASPPAPPSPRRSRRPRRLPPGVVAAAAARGGAAVTFFALRGRPRALAFSVGDEPFASTVGRHVAPPADRPVPVHFSDGSELEIEAES